MDTEKFLKMIIKGLKVDLKQINPKEDEENNLGDEDIMAKKIWKPGTFIYPIPAVLVTSGDMKNSNMGVILRELEHPNKTP